MAKISGFLAPTFWSYFYSYLFPVLLSFLLDTISWIFLPSVLDYFTNNHRISFEPCVHYSLYNIREARQMPRQFCTICILIRVSYMMFPLFLWFLPSSSFFEDDDDWLETFLCVNYYFIDSTLRILCLYISTWLLFFLLIFSTSFFFVSYPHGLCNASTGNTKFWKNVIVEIWNFDKTFSFYYHN